MPTIYKPVRLAIAATRWKASDRSSTFAALLPDAKARGDQDCLCLLLLRIYFVLNWKLQAIVYRMFFLRRCVCSRHLIVNFQQHVSQFVG